jgi:hypothetical protein
MTANPYEASRVPEPLVMPAHATSGTPSEVEFDLTLEDYVVFNQEHTDRLFAMRLVRLALTLVVGLSVAIGVAIYLFTTPAEPGVMAFLILWAVVNLLAFIGIAIWWNHRRRPWGSGWFLRWYITRGDTSSIFGRHRIVLSPHEIYERSPKAESRLAMSIVTRIVVTTDYAFVYISPIQAFIIPRRAFFPPATFDAFVRTLEEYSGVRAEPA